MKPSVWKALSAIVLICMVVVIVVSKALGGCDKMIDAETGPVYMKCHWTFVSIFFIAFAGAVSAVLALVSKTKEGRRVSALATIAICAVIACILSPFGIGICASADMECHVASYITWAAIGISVVISAIQIAKADPYEHTKPKMQL